jgi:hypothetical protein
MSEQKDNQALEEYLKGNSDLSRRYRAESKTEPPAHLDAAIISAAKNALNNDKAGAGPSISRWYVPLSLAAVLVISFSLVFRVYDQEEQQILSKQSEIKKEKPAMRMESEPQPATAPPAVLMRDEFHSSEEIRIETDAASATRAAPATVEDISKDDALSGVEAGQPATQSVESLSMPAEQRMQKSMSEVLEDKAIAGNALQPQQWFENINQLWFDGDKAGAIDATRRFLEAYPDYPLDQLKKMLPQEMDLSEIVPKRALTP